MSRRRGKVELALGKNESWRLNRPAWTSTDLYSYRHLHDHGEIRQNYFNKSEKTA